MNALQAYVERHPGPLRELADKIGISRSYLAEILAGTKKPGRETIAKIEAGTAGAVPAASWFEQHQQ